MTERRHNPSPHEMTLREWLELIGLALFALLVANVFGLVVGLMIRSACG